MSRALKGNAGVVAAIRTEMQDNLRARTKLSGLVAR